MLGAIIGDIAGSRFEWHNIKSKEFDLLTYRCRPTDDSIMTFAVAQALLSCADGYDDLSQNAVKQMQALGQKYPNAGYGGNFRKWIYAENPQPYNSWGNGSAMRVSPCAWAASSLDEALSLSDAVTKVTHNHPEGITYDGELDLNDTKRISVPEKELAGCLVKKGDVLFNRTNSRDLVGKTCVFNLDEPMIIAGYIIRLRMNGRVIPEYLSTFLNLENSKRMLFAMAKGAVGQANINAQEVQAIELIIPPMDVQVPFQQLVKQSDKSKFVVQKCSNRNLSGGFSGR